MSRSSKKGPFVDQYLLNKVEALDKAGKKDIIKTWSRRSTIYPQFVEHTFAVYNGKEHITVFVTLRDRGHGRPQARRIRPDPYVPGTPRQ